MEQGLSMRLSHEEVERILDVMFFAMSACTALVQEQEALKAGKEPTLELLEMIEKLTNLVPISMAVLVGELISKDNRIELNGVERELIFLWVLKAKQEKKGRQNDN